MTWPCRTSSATSPGCTSISLGPRLPRARFLIETPDGLSVIEVNHSGEFRNSIEPTGIDIPGAMADWVLAQEPIQLPAQRPDEQPTEVTA